MSDKKEVEEEFTALWSSLRSNIKLLLEQKGESISYFADRNNIDRGNMSKVLSGRLNDMYLSTLHKIANGFDMSVSELIEWTPDRE